MNTHMDMERYLETNSIVVTSDNNREFDYPKTTTQNVTNNYKGERRNFIKLYR